MPPTIHLQQLSAPTILEVDIVKEEVSQDEFFPKLYFELKKDPTISSGHPSMFVIIDQLSKYVHFIPLSHLYSAKIVANVFVKEIVRSLEFQTMIKR